LTLLFLVYATMMGASLSFIFSCIHERIYFPDFIAAASMYIVMGIVGYTTKNRSDKNGKFSADGFAGNYYCGCCQFFPEERFAFLHHQFHQRNYFLRIDSMGYSKTKKYFG